MFVSSPTYLKKPSHDQTFCLFSYIHFVYFFTRSPTVALCELLIRLEQPLKKQTQENREESKQELEINPQKMRTIRNKSKQRIISVLRTRFYSRCTWVTCREMLGDAGRCWVLILARYIQTRGLHFTKTYIVSKCAPHLPNT